MKRSCIYSYLFKISENWYRTNFKKNVMPWNITLEELKDYSKKSLGYNYYHFLTQQKFNILPKLETHDVFHVLTKSNTEVKTELALQYYLLGNGKRSVYQALGIISSIFYLDELPLFIRAFKNGKRSSPFHHLNYEILLKHPLAAIQTKYNIIPLNTKP